MLQGWLSHSLSFRFATKVKDPMAREVSRVGSVVRDSNTLNGEDERRKESMTFLIRGWRGEVEQRQPRPRSAIRAASNGKCM